MADVRIDIDEAGPLGEKTVHEAAETAPVGAIADSVSKLYESNGYPMARAEVDIDSISEGEVRVTVDIIPGPISSVEEYSITGFPLEMPQLEIVEGKPFIQWKLARDMEKLVQLLEDSGYPFASVEIDSLAIGPFQPEKIPVRIHLVVEPDDTVWIQQVIIPEDSKTKGYVIERLMLLDLPELYSQTNIDKGVERIQDIGWLNVSGDPQLLLDETGFWLLRVTVSEGRSVIINGVLGYDPAADGGSRLTGHLDAAFYNIKGTGRWLSLMWDQVSNEKLEIGATYSEPWLLGGPGDLQLSGNYYDVDSTYSEREIALDYELPLNFKLNIITGIGYRAVAPDSIGQNILNIPTSREYSLQTGLEWQNLRPRTNPRKGVNSKLSVKGSYIERSGPEELFEELKRYEPIFRTELDFEAAREIFKRHVFYLGIYGRSALSSGPLPLSDQYYLGGWGSLRGYREEQFSAEHVGWANAEWRLIVSSDAHGYAFFDAGLIRPSGRSEEFKFGYGIGLRLNTAIGMWDVSYGVGQGASLTGGFIHVGLSTGFE